MSEYTPTTEWAIVTLAEGVPLPTWDECEKVARDWLAQHDAEVAKAAKVEALREAADAYNGSDDLAEMMRAWQWDEHVAFLRARADRIEGEK